VTAKEKLFINHVPILFSEKCLTKLLKLEFWLDPSSILESLNLKMIDMKGVEKEKLVYIR